MKRKEELKMKIVHRILGFISAIAFILILLITSFEIACYSDFGWYQKEYEKYGVLSELEMEMEDAMEVTHEMMDYLRGDREDLVVYTTVDGVEREFFNDREKAHMVDVKNLFLGGLDLRLGAGCVFVAAIAVLVFSKGDWKKILPQSFIWGLAGFIGFMAIFAILCVSDFTKYFTIFHEIFFDNDLWILDWRTDLLIRMLPEGFFADMVVRIGIIFVSFLVFSLVGSIVVLKKQKN